MLTIFLYISRVSLTSSEHICNRFELSESFKGLIALDSWRLSSDEVDQARILASDRHMNFLGGVHAKEFGGTIAEQYSIAESGLSTSIFYITIPLLP
jgi:hypothetical protein